MAAKKVKVQVAGDGIQVDGRWYHNGDTLTLTEAKAKELLKASTVIKAP